jgi:membrane peptidoglycan carboxypeptidase
LFDETDRPGSRVLDRDVADCAASILHGPLYDPEGTASGKSIPGHDAFGKTGTTDQQTSATFLGGTPDLVSFVWHGVPDLEVPGAGSGGERPATIWNDFMTRALENRPDDPFPPAGPACDAPGKFVDAVLGRTADVPPPAPPPTRGTSRPAPAPPSASGPEPGRPAPPAPQTPQTPVTQPPVTQPPTPPPPTPQPPLTVPRPPGAGV